MIKAIETRYKGYRFRSRLEARWAVFFDKIGVRWDYEPEGYELPSGRYLPDFLIRSTVDGDEKINFVEIKGASATPVDIALCDELATHLKCCGHLLEGDPVALSGYRFFPVIDLQGPAPIQLDELAFMAWAWTGFGQQPSLDEINAATVAARSARFEHGESGA